MASDRVCWGCLESCTTCCWRGTAASTALSCVSSSAVESPVSAHCTRNLLLVVVCLTDCCVCCLRVFVYLSGAGVVWGNWARPFEIRGYVITLLLHCVKIHADTMSIVPSELKRVLGAALEVICGMFREEVDLIATDLSLHSAEQLNLELNFITTTLEEYETAVSAGRAKMCRTLLSKKRLAAIDGMDRRAREEQSADDTNFQRIHHAAFMANEVMFCCFRTQAAVPVGTAAGGTSGGGTSGGGVEARVEAKAGAERRRAEQQRLGATPVRGAAAAAERDEFDDAPSPLRQAKDSGVGSAFFHSKPGRPSLAGLAPAGASAAAADAAAVAAASGAASASAARTRRQGRLETTASARGPLRTPGSNGSAPKASPASRPRPRTPPGPGRSPASTAAAAAPIGGAAAAQAAALRTAAATALRRGAPSESKYSTARHVKPQQPVVPHTTSPGQAPPMRGGGGTGLTLSPASVASSRPGKPPSPPRSAPGVGGMASATAAMTSAARAGKATRRRRGGDV